MKIILISGKAGSGKSSLANILKEKLDKCVVTNYSKYIKLFAIEMLNWDGSDENKPRSFLQEMGDTLRSINKNFLTDRMLQDISVYSKYYDYVVISVLDCMIVEKIESYLIENGISPDKIVRINKEYLTKENLPKEIGMLIE